jgi:hypothetical protein
MLNGTFLRPAGLCTLLATLAYCSDQQEAELALAPYSWQYAKERYLYSLR